MATGRFGDKGDGLATVAHTRRWALGAAADFRRAAALAVVYHGNSWEEVAGAANQQQDADPYTADELEWACRQELAEVRELLQARIGVSRPQD